MPENNTENNLRINPEVVCEIISKARAFHAKEEVSFPEITPSDDDFDWAQVLADHKDDLTYLETKTAINNLEPDQQIELVALMYLGRGDYDKSEWQSALDVARDLWRSNTAEYLLSRPLVADHLEEGLALFGYSCSED